MNKVVKKQKTEQTELIPQYANPWLEAAAESGNETGPLLKFNKGAWLVGDDTVPIGTEYIAHIDQVMHGWVKFVDGKVVDRNVGKVADSFKPPKREELSDTDPAKWEKDADDGQPRDPWSEQWFLPLVSVGTGELVTFVTGSKGGIGAVADLCGVYGRKQRDGLLPILALRTRSYKHKKYGKIETPDFTIVGWDDSAVSATKATAIPAQPGLPAQEYDDMANMEPVYDKF